MKRRKRVEITVETSLLIVRRSTSRTPVWCTACSSPVRSVTPGEAAALAGVSERTVYRWVEAGRLHFMETAEQALVICLDSLLGSTDD